MEENFIRTENGKNFLHLFKKYGNIYTIMRRKRGVGFCCEIQRESGIYRTIFRKISSSQSLISIKRIEVVRWELLIERKPKVALEQIW